MSDNIVKCNILSDKAIALLSSFSNSTRDIDYPPSENISRSSILSEENLMFKTHVTWNIKTCELNNKQPGKYIASSQIEVDSHPFSNLWFRLYPKGICSKSQSLDFCVHFRNLLENVHILCDVALIDHSKNVILKETFSGYGRNIQENTVNFLNFCPLSKLAQYQEQEKFKEVLTIQCRIKLLSRIYTCVSGKFTHVVKMNSEVSKLSADILESGKYSDITLVSEHQKLKSHKFILASQSPSLHILLKVDHNDVLELDISKYHLLQKLLKFVYTGKFRIFSFSDAIDYYTISSKFEILNLKDICTTYLIASLTEKNISCVWDISRSHQDEYLFNACVSFIKTRDIDVESFMKKCF